MVLTIANGGWGIRTAVSSVEAARVRSELESAGGWVDVRPAVHARQSDVAAIVASGVEARYP